jgi:hypothetical protein
MTKVMNKKVKKLINELENENGFGKNRKLIENLKNELESLDEFFELKVK